MRIAIFSDIHLEFGQFTIPDLGDEHEIVLVLAGDIGLIKRATSYRIFIDNVCDRFKEIIWIMGNHEYYGSNFPTAMAKLWVATLDHENLHILNNETITIEDVSFVCATLWTNFDNLNAVTMDTAGLWMNDYKNIRTGPNSEPWKRKLRPVDIAQEHHTSRQYIFKAIVAEKSSNRKVVVVTHHAPSFLSIHEAVRTGTFDGCYASNLAEDILDTKPDLWCHGHTHFSADYFLGDSRVVCNPRGYAPDDINPEFEDTFIIEV